MIRILDGAEAARAHRFLHRGDACEEEATKKELDGATIMISLIIGVLNVLVCVVALVYYIVKGSAKLIHNSQPKFLYLISVGGIIVFVSTLFSIMPPDETSCHGTIWAGALGIMIQFAALFTKTYRIHKIFNNKKIRKFKVTEAGEMRVWAWAGHLSRTHQHTLNGPPLEPS